ncbi:hypothetical protein TVAG_302360 [Trichomonas vaginalis G3]|uniref:Uncharacterized protein n=1 Tax=Trichomonas vaginalis (strain ATCC PRA-98 / G3) TaxID=412133 RepID=A2EGR1_TRIV3|nr:hypothetical protein TVAGG3_0172950 [Trichomonas vaginalis G3]EAY08149.1 hypothetical protein TVAG_302360 [Trichomonas vaginalis G3]KAI5548720.1 hypothetical protein TVAGG3_0172950 [Trichomonas vaginalis G3]|eukprot:XP_001320372.1 hypothetical protein [Trichomonas vaginalis G3]
MSFVDSDDEDFNESNYNQNSSIYGKERVFTLIISKKGEKVDLHPARTREMHFRFSFDQKTIEDIPPTQVIPNKSQNKNNFQLIMQDSHTIQQESSDEFEESDNFEEEEENIQEYIQEEEEEFEEEVNEQNQFVGSSDVEEEKYEPDTPLKIQDLATYIEPDQEDELDEKNSAENILTFNEEEEFSDDIVTAPPVQNNVVKQPPPIDNHQKQIKIDPKNVKQVEKKEANKPKIIPKEKETAKTAYIPETKNQNHTTFDLPNNTMSSISQTRSKLVIHSKIHTDTRSTIEPTSQVEPERKRRPSQRPELKHRSTTIC